MSYRTIRNLRVRGSGIQITAKYQRKGPKHLHAFDNIRLSGALNTVFRAVLSREQHVVELPELLVQPPVQYFLRIIGETKHN